MSLRRRFAAAILSAALAGCAGAAPTPPIPPLLQGATAGSGTGGCPAYLARYPRSPCAHSPEVEARLSRDFPAGSPGGALEAELRRQSFLPAPPCEDDPSIHQMYFQQAADHCFCETTWANVQWKTDAAGRIVWTRANVEYTFL
jgi:hypothetical protein